MRSDQRLWPLLMLASTLAVVGYWLAFRKGRAEVSEEPAHSVAIERPGEGSAVAAEPLVLNYRPGPARTLEIQFGQTDRAGRAEISTGVDLEVHERRRERADGEPGVRFLHRYRKVGVSIDEGGTVIGPRISRQIESLLLDVESVVEVDAVGRPKDHSWNSVTNPQVRQTLRMLRHAQTLLMPRPRRGAVNVEDEWQYRLAARLLESHYVHSIDGSILVRERLADIVERDGSRIAVIERSLRLDARGELRLPEDAKRRTFELSGSGSGEAHFAAEEGELVYSGLEIERQLEIGNESADRAKRIGRIEWSLREKPTPE